jgi:hypothetical protein
VAFALHGDFADAREARGRGQALALLPERFPLAEHPALHHVVESKAFHLAQLLQEDPALSRHLMREGKQTCLLLPISVRGRVVIVHYGGFDAEPVTLEPVGDRQAFCPLVAQSFERAILARKGHSTSGSPVSFRPRRRRFVAPSAEDRAKALADLMASDGGRQDSGNSSS